MSTYRTEWPCCGDATETEARAPESCPFCKLDTLTREVEWLSEERDALAARVERMEVLLREGAEVLCHFGDVPQVRAEWVARVEDALAKTAGDDS